MIHARMLCIIALLVCGCDAGAATVETWQYSGFSVSFGGIRSGAVVAGEHAGPILFVRDPAGTVRLMSELSEVQVAKYCRMPLAHEDQRQSDETMYDIGTERFVFLKGKCIYVVCFPGDAGFAFSTSETGPFFEDYTSKGQAEKAFGKPNDRSVKSVPRI